MPLFAVYSAKQGPTSGAKTAKKIKKTLRKKKLRKKTLMKKKLTQKTLKKKKLMKKTLAKKTPALLMTGKVLHVASACTGLSTETVALTRVLGRKVTHEFMCDNNCHVQRLLQDNYPGARRSSHTRVALENEQQERGKQTHAAQSASSATESDD
jgi:hypothetical protein